MQRSVMAKLQAEGIAVHGCLAKALLHLHRGVLFLDRQRAGEVELPEYKRREGLLELRRGKACL
jgi:hypothetical protein